MRVLPKMADNFDQILDRCIDRIQAGEGVDKVVADYPGESARLKPMLIASFQATRTYSYTPSIETKRAARQGFTAAMTEMREARRQRQPWLRRAFARRATWAAMATVAAAVVLALISVQPALSPFSSSGSQVLPISPVTSATGNFAFLISDEVNAIADFDSVVVGIERIGLQRKEDAKWIEFQPQLHEVDLTHVPGDAVKEIWRGEIPTGEFSQVFVFVDNVTGILKATGATTEIKLPSSKLHLSIPFEVTEETVTSFTYDMTVFATGDGRNQRYLLKPQIGESGASQNPRQRADGGGAGGNNGNSGIPGNPSQGTDDRDGPGGRPTSLPTPTDKPRKE